MLRKRALLILVALVTPVLMGSQCVFVASSRNNHVCVSTVDRPCKPKNKNDPVVVIAVENGRFIDAPVQGLRYESGSLSGVSGKLGGFQYEAGNTVRFFVGDIALGEAAKGKPLVTPLDLIPNGTIDTPSVINIARLLQSLDFEPGDNLITLPARLHTTAVRSNGEISASIQNLDYADDTAFANAASQLISTLTAFYPFTAVLVDRQSAREHLARQLDMAGLSTGN